VASTRLCGRLANRGHTAGVVDHLDRGQDRNGAWQRRSTSRVDRAREHVRKELVVIVEEHDPTPERAVEARVSCGTHPDRAVVAEVNDALVLGLAIGNRGSVVDDDQLELGQRLSKHAVDRSSRELRSVLRRQHHTHDRIAHHLRLSYQAMVQ
jgi:hypothetical protein